MAAANPAAQPLPHLTLGAKGSSTAKLATSLHLNSHDRPAFSLIDSWLGSSFRFELDEAIQTQTVAQTPDDGVPAGLITSTSPGLPMVPPAGGALQLSPCPCSSCTGSMPGWSALGPLEITSPAPDRFVTARDVYTSLAKLTAVTGSGSASSSAPYVQAARQRGGRLVIGLALAGDTSSTTGAHSLVVIPPSSRALVEFTVPQGQFVVHVDVGVPGALPGSSARPSATVLVLQPPGTSQPKLVSALSSICPVANAVPCPSFPEMLTRLRAEISSAGPANLSRVVGIHLEDCTVPTDLYSQLTAVFQEAQSGGSSSLLCLFVGAPGSSEPVQSFSRQGLTSYSLGWDGSPDAKTRLAFALAFYKAVTAVPASGSAFIVERAALLAHHCSHRVPRADSGGASALAPVAKLSGRSLGVVDPMPSSVPPTAPPSAVGGTSQAPGVSMSGPASSAIFATQPSSSPVPSSGIYGGGMMPPLPHASLSMSMIPGGPGSATMPSPAFHPDLPNTPFSLPATPLMMPSTPGWTPLALGPQSMQGLSWGDAAATMSGLSAGLPAGSAAASASAATSTKPSASNGFHGTLGFSGPSLPSSGTPAGMRGGLGQGGTPHLGGQGANGAAGTGSGHASHDLDALAAAAAALATFPSPHPTPMPSPTGPLGAGGHNNRRRLSMAEVDLGAAVGSVPGAHGGVLDITHTRPVEYPGTCARTRPYSRPRSRRPSLSVGAFDWFNPSFPTTDLHSYQNRRNSFASDPLHLQGPIGHGILPTPQFGPNSEPPSPALSFHLFGDTSLPGGSSAAGFTHPSPSMSPMVAAFGGPLGNIPLMPLPGQAAFGGRGRAGSTSIAGDMGLGGGDPAALSRRIKIKHYAKPDPGAPAASGKGGSGAGKARKTSVSSTAGNGNGAGGGAPGRGKGAAKKGAAIKNESLAGSGMPAGLPGGAPTSLATAPKVPAAKKTKGKGAAQSPAAAAAAAARAAKGGAAKGPGPARAGAAVDGNGNGDVCILCHSIQRRSAPSACNQLTAFSSKERMRYNRVLNDLIKARGISFTKDELKTRFRLTPKQQLLAAYKKVGPWPHSALQAAMDTQASVHRHCRHAVRLMMNCFEPASSDNKSSLATDVHPSGTGDAAKPDTPADGAAVGGKRKGAPVAAPKAAKLTKVIKPKPPVVSRPKPKSPK